MKHALHLVFVAIIFVGSGCSNESKTTSAEALRKSTLELLDKVKPAPKVTIPAGTRLRVSLVDGFSTTTNSPGDEFLASLVEPVIVEGRMVLEQGTKVRGRTIDVQESGKAPKSRPEIELILTEIMRSNGSVAVATKPVVGGVHTVENSQKLIPGDDTAVGSAGTNLTAKGNGIHYPPETRFSFILASSVEI